MQHARSAAHIGNSVLRFSARPALAAIGLLALAGSALGQSPSLSYRTVALSGDHAPGTSDGVYFSALTTPLNHSFLRPAIDAQGNVGFTALLAGSGVNQYNDSGVWSEVNGELTLVARGGQHAPGTPGGVNFFEFPSDYLPSPPKLAAGRAAFQASLTGDGVNSSNDEGLWAGAPGDLELVGRAGEAAPGVPGATFDFVGMLAIDNAGRILLFDRLNGSGITNNNDEIIWSYEAGSFETVVREGEQAPGFPTGTVISGPLMRGIAIEGAFADDVRRPLIQAGIMNSGVDSYSDEVVFATVDGALAPLAREGDQAPGLPDGVVYGQSVGLIFRAFEVNESGHVTFHSRLSGAEPTHTGVFTNRDGEVELLVRDGDPAPGRPYNFGLMGIAHLNEHDQVAFTAATPDDDGDPFTPPPRAIWHDMDGSLATLVHPDEALPGLPDVILGSASGIVGFSDDGHFAFTGSFNDSGAGETIGLLMVSPEGQAAIVAHYLQEFELPGAPGDVRTVIRYEPGGMSDGGELAFRLDFDDGTSGHFVASFDSGIPGDLNGDGCIDQSDLGELLAAYGIDAGGDLDGDGDTDQADLGELLGHYGDGC